MTHPNRRTFLKQTAGGMAALTLPGVAASAITPLPASLMPVRLRQEVSVALIGAGRQGRTLLTELGSIQGVKIAAICDVVESRLRSAERRAQNATAYADYRELLERETGVNSVFIATPTHLHRDIAIACIESGKHVYCECPLASTIEDCRAIVQAARRAQTVFQTGMLGRSNPIHRLARTFVLSDSVRDVLAIDAQQFVKNSWRSAARDPADDKLLNWRLDPEVSLGLAGEFGTQQFDAVQWFRSMYPVSVRGSGSILVYEDGRTIPDTIQCLLTFPNGEKMTYRASLGTTYGKTYELYIGTNATVKTAWTHGWMFKEPDAPTQGWEVYANRQQFGNEEGITLIADATKLASQGKLKEGVGLERPSEYYAIGDFLRAITEGAAPVCTADEGLRAAVVGICAHRAVMTGEEIEIDQSLFREV